MVISISNTSEKSDITRALPSPIVEDITSSKVHQQEKELEIIVQQAPHTVPAVVAAASASTLAFALTPTSTTT